MLLSLTARRSAAGLPQSTGSAFRKSSLSSKAPPANSSSHRSAGVAASSAVVVVTASSNRGFGAKPSPSSSFPSPSSTPPKNEPPIPASREEAIAQAATALAASLSSSSSSSPSLAAAEALSSKKKGNKSPQGFARPSQPARASLEVPIADESPAATAALAVDLLRSRAVPSKTRVNLRLAFGDVDAALAASDLLSSSDDNESSVSVSALDDDDDEENDDEESPNSLLLIVAPTPQQAPRVASLLSSKKFKTRDAALLNPKWEALAPPAGLSGFQPSYAFVPLAVQGFLGATTTAGVMLCARTPGGPAQPLWRIYKDETGRGDFVVVGRSQKRPGPRDIEDAFYNSAAASSPVTKGVAAIRGVFNNKK